MTLYQKFQQYKKATGGQEALAPIVPFGYPSGVEENGGVEAVYDECIRRGITWEDLLGYHPPEDADI